MYYSNGRPLTLKRGSAEWFNEDCPPIETKDGDRIFSNFINGVYISDDALRPALYRFIKASHDLFCKKDNYPP